VVDKKYVDSLVKEWESKFEKERESGGGYGGMFESLFGTGLPSFQEWAKKRLSDAARQGITAGLRIREADKRDSTKEEMKREIDKLMAKVAAAGFSNPNFDPHNSGDTPQGKQGDETDGGNSVGDQEPDND